jgi:hypothetical protein
MMLYFAIGLIVALYICKDAVNKEWFRVELEERIFHYLLLFVSIIMFWPLCIVMYAISAIALKRM